MYVWVHAWRHTFACVNPYIHAYKHKYTCKSAWVAQICPQNIYTHTRAHGTFQNIKFAQACTDPEQVDISTKNNMDRPWKEPEHIISSPCTQLTCVNKHALAWTQILKCLIYFLYNGRRTPGNVPWILCRPHPKAFCWLERTFLCDISPLWKLVRWGPSSGGLKTYQTFSGAFCACDARKRFAIEIKMPGVVWASARIRASMFSLED